MPRDYGERLNLIAAVLYDAFVRAAPNNQPTWVELTPEARRQWVAVAREATKVTTSGHH